MVGLQITVRTTFARDQLDFTAQFATLQRSGARVVALFCQSSDGSRFIRDGLQAGIGGDGFLFFVGFTVSSSVWTSNAELSANGALRLRVFKGFFGMNPSSGEGTAAYDRYLARRRQLPSTEGDNSSCNLETDDDGNLLWCVLPRLERDRRCSRAGLPRHMLHRIRCFTAPWPPPLVGPRTTMTTLPRP